MEAHNTTTFPHKKYYSLDAYHRKKIEKAMKKGSTKATKTERVVFDDEEQHRLELQREREKQKEAEVEALKRSMQSGMVRITFLSVNIWYLVSGVYLFKRHENNF
ncbi:hypothetical protein LXL04_028036 [Taraxacum kok-saghyz]